jgi:hypothetical protein
MKRTCHSVTVSTPHPIWAGLESKPGLPGNRPTASRRSTCFIGGGIQFRWVGQSRSGEKISSTCGSQEDVGRLCSTCDVVSIEFGTKKEDMEFDDTQKTAGSQYAPYCVLRARRL